LPSTWEDYLRGLSGNSRRNILRSLKAFDDWCGGTTRLEAVTGLDDLERGRRVLIDLHHSRWSESAGTNPPPRNIEKGVFRSSLYLDFHEEMMQILAGRGELELLWLCARDEPVAALYAMVWKGKVYAYQCGRQLDVPPEVRPGGVLLALAIRRAIEAGRHEFDLLADEAFYKNQLATGARALVRMRIARPSFVEGIRRTFLLCRGGLRSITGSRDEA
jgi:hypothetical protein